jgi:hypothetical protein
MNTLHFNLALYFTASVVLYATGHWIAGTVMFGAFLRVAHETGI